MVLVDVQVGRLRQWQQQMPPLKRPPSAATTAAAPQLQPPLKRHLPANTQLLPQEFGSNLDIKILDGAAAMAWFIPAASSSNAASRRQQLAAMAGGAATPAELRQVFATEAMGDDLGWGGGGRTSGGEEDGLEVDIDSDDEKRGKGKKVGDALCLRGRGVVSGGHIGWVGDRISREGAGRVVARLMVKRRMAWRLILTVMMRRDGRATR